MWQAASEGTNANTNYTILYVTEGPRDAKSCIDPRRDVVIHAAYCYRRAAVVRSVHPRGAAYCNCGYGGTTGWPTSRLCLVLLCCICVDKYNIHLLIQVSVTVRGIRGVSPEEGKEGYGGNTMFNVAKLLCVVCRLKNIPIKDDAVAEN